MPKLFYDSRLEDALPVASSTAAGFDVRNLRDFKTFTWWQATALPATVTVDSGAPAAVDYWGLWGHDLGTQGATIELRGSTDNFVASDVEVDSVTPADDRPFIRQITSTSFRYRRLQIPSGATDEPRIAIALLGELLEVPVGLRSFDPKGIEPQGNLNRSEKGQPLGTTFQFESFERSVRFDNLLWAWIRSTWEPAWEEHLRGAPHIFAWDATDHANEIALVNTDGGYKTPHRPIYTDLSYKIVGLKR